MGKAEAETNTTTGLRSCLKNANHQLQLQAQFPQLGTYTDVYEKIDSGSEEENSVYALINQDFVNETFRNALSIEEQEIYEELKDIFRLLAQSDVNPQTAVYLDQLLNQHSHYQRGLPETLILFRKWERRFIKQLNSDYYLAQVFQSNQLTINGSNLKEIIEATIADSNKKSTKGFFDTTGIIDALAEGLDLPDSQAIADFSQKLRQFNQPVNLLNMFEPVSGWSAQKQKIFLFAAALESMHKAKTQTTDPECLVEIGQKRVWRERQFFNQISAETLAFFDQQVNYETEIPIPPYSSPQTPDLLQTRVDLSLPISKPLLQSLQNSFPNDEQSRNQYS